MRFFNQGEYFMTRRVARVSLLVVGVLLSCLSTSVPAAQITPQLMTVLERGAVAESVPIIVTFAAAEASEQQARPMGRSERSAFVRTMKARSQKRLEGIQDGLTQKHARQLRHLWLIDGAALDATPAEIEQLRQMPGIAAITLDETFVMPAVQMSATDNPTWNIERIGAPDLWARGYRGEGITIAVLDSGVNLAHPDLEGRWRGLAGDWFDPYGNSSSPYDFDSYHGTAVASIVVGGSAGGSAIGVAPGASIIAAKVFRDDGMASSSAIIEILQWVLNPGDDPDRAPHIVNMSWGFEDNADECLETLSGTYLLRQALQTVRAAGIAVIAAAGNSGPNPYTSTSPANFPETVAAGATDGNNRIAVFSARGPSACAGAGLFPDLVAPGLGVRAAGVGSSYRIVSGTSFASAHVAGAMALLMQAAAPLPVTEIENLLTLSAADLGAGGADDTYGYGLVNLPAAWDRAELLQGLVVTPERLDFAVVTAGEVAREVIDVVNISDAALHLEIDRAGIEEPFSLTENRCPDILEPEQACRMTISFTPVASGDFTGRMVVGDQNAAYPDVIIDLVGTGNMPPAKPALLFPEDGARLNGEDEVLLRWSRVADADGDEVAYTLLVADNPAFVDANLYSVAATGAWLAGIALLFGVRPLRRRVVLPLLLVTLVYLASCGGGGGGSGGDDQTLSISLDDLEPGTTNYWKVRVVDARGGVAESAVRSFFVE